MAGAALWRYVTEKSIMLLVRLAAAGDSLVRHAGRAAAGRVADCGLATGIGTVGICGSPNNCHISLHVWHNTMHLIQ